MKLAVLISTFAAYVIILNFCIFSFSDKKSEMIVKSYSPSTIEIRMNGIIYSPVFHSEGRQIRKKDLGYRIGKVGYCMPGIIELEYMSFAGVKEIKNTPIYAVKGYDSNFRVATYDLSLGPFNIPMDRSLRLYEVYENPKARKGKDLLDIRGKVKYIRIYNMEMKEIAVIEDRKKVELLTNLALEGDVIGHDFYSEEQYGIAFHLRDGTAIIRWYLLKDSLLGSIKVPDVFASEVRKAIESKK